MSGVVYSEWRTPIEYAGSRFLCTVTRSGQCAPGPGVCILSIKGTVIEKYVNVTYSNNPIFV